AGGDRTLSFSRIAIRHSGKVTSTVPIFEPFDIEVQFSATTEMNGEIGIIVRTTEGVPLIRSSSSDNGTVSTFTAGQHRHVCHVAPNHLRAGRYSILVGSTCSHLRDLIEDAISFDIVETRPYSLGTLFNMPGFLHFDFKWTDLGRGTGAI